MKMQATADSFTSTDQTSQECPAPLSLRRIDKVDKEKVDYGTLQN
jgi:hypothetical protein